MEPLLPEKPVRRGRRGNNLTFTGSAFRFHIERSYGAVRIARVGGAEEDRGMANSFRVVRRDVTAEVEFLDPPASG